MQVMRESFKKIFNAAVRNKYILAVLLLGVVLILFPTRSSKNETVPKEDEPPLFLLEDEERRIEKALSEADGAGQVKIVLTLKTGTERVLAEDVQLNISDEGDLSDTESTVSTVVISSGSSREEPVTLKYIYPEYTGALVVAEGAGSAEVRLLLTQAVASLTGLSSDKITVIKMKGS